jgi:hypothetical protein
MDGDVFAALKAEVDTIPIADAHEHLIPPDEALREDVDLFSLFESTYLKGDLVSAGMPADYWVRQEFDPAEGWRRIRPYIDRVRNTSYYRSLLAALRDLYNFDDAQLGDDNWHELSDKILAANKDESWYSHVLKEKAVIEVLLQDTDDQRYLVPRVPAAPVRDRSKLGNSRCADTEMGVLLPVLRIDPLLYGYADFVFQEESTHLGVYHYGRRALEKEYDVSLDRFDDYLRLVDTAFTTAVTKGAVAAKSLAAYRRVLYFEPVSRADAEKIFIKRGSDVAPAEAKAFQDYITHLVIQKSIEYGLPIQFHTGMQYGFGNVLANSSPLHLTNLFSAYPQARFVLLHGGYPYGGEVSVLAKTYPNVYLDFSWLPLISPTVAERSLAEWLDTVPGSKLHWGGDCVRVEAVYGHVLQVRAVVTHVLAEKVTRGYFSEDVALDLAKKILRDNVRQIYGLDDE